MAAANLDTQDQKRVAGQQKWGVNE
jgi:hypothetical protein